MYEIFISASNCLFIHWLLSPFSPCALTKSRAFPQTFIRTVLGLHLLPENDLGFESKELRVAFTPIILV